MIRVTIELIPYGEEDEKQTLETLEIVNDGTGGMLFGHYDVYHRRGEQTVNGKRVDYHPRAQGVVPLVIRALGGQP